MPIAEKNNNDLTRTHENNTARHPDQRKNPAHSRRQCTQFPFSWMDTGKKKKKKKETAKSSTTVFWTRRRLAKKKRSNSFSAVHLTYHTAQHRQHAMMYPAPTQTGTPPPAPCPAPTKAKNKRKLGPQPCTRRTGQALTKIPEATQFFSVVLRS